MFRDVNRHGIKWKPIMEIRLHPFELPFRFPFGISRATKTVQPLMVVELLDQGFCGLGETADNAYYQMTLPKLAADLLAQQPFLESYTFLSPEQLWDDLYPRLAHNMFALCALDMAAWDLFARRAGKKLYEIWGLDVSKNPLTDYTIGLDHPDIMLQKMEQKPWPIYKIKMGTDQDMDILEQLRAKSNAVFRIDANCGWTFGQAKAYGPTLKRLGIEFVEQPLPADAWHQMKELYPQYPVPLMADESCITEDQVLNCVKHFHGINIKLTKCGGITPALRMISRAKGLGLKVMVGSMNESTVGTSAVAHLLPLLDYVDMDGPLLLAADTATGVWFEHGHIRYPDEPGIGARLTASSFKVALS